MWVPLSSTPRQFNKSFPHKRATPFQPPKTLSSTSAPLCSTPKTPQFHPSQFHTPSVPHTPQFHTRNPSVQHTPQTKTVLNGGVFGVEPKVFRCGTEEFLVLNWGILVFNWEILGAEKVWSLCWTHVLNWGVLNMNINRIIVICCMLGERSLLNLHYWTVLFYI